MTRQPTVSVLMTAFNRSAYIGAAIESVLGSTYGDLELVVVDDASSDETVEVAEEYARTDSRVRVYRNDTNLGDYPNRNRAASLATGKYLKYLDSDDLLYPHGLGVMVSAIEEHAEAALAFSTRMLEDQRQPYPIQVTPLEAYREHFLRGGMLDFGPTGAIIRTAVYREIGPFGGAKLVSDTEYWLRITARYPILKVGPALIWWRQHEGQETEFERANWYFIAQQRFTVALKALESPACPLPERERQQALRSLRRVWARAAVRDALVNRNPLRLGSSLRNSPLTAAEVVRGLVSPV
jgi:glycosyltransferase involved in cell wall biosynthesis